MRAWRALGSLALASCLASWLVACGAAPLPAAAPEPSREPPRVRYAVALRLEEAGESEEGTPHTRVSLVRISPDGVRTVETLATEVGACYHQPRPGALLAARCWWAGFGAEYEVRREGDAVVALRASIDEERGAAPLAEVARLSLPPDIELDVLGGR